MLINAVFAATLPLPGPDRMTGPAGNGPYLSISVENHKGSERTEQIMADTILVLGATGQLGQAVMAVAGHLGLEAVGAARTGAHLDLDITDDKALARTVALAQAGMVVNCAALVSLDRCEQSPDLAWRINGRAVAVLAEACRDAEAKLVHISTDHFFIGDHDALHDEDAPVRLVNEYARTKYAGERFALAAPDGLAIRTNITGFRGRTAAPTFVEWLIRALENREPLTLFTDFYTSTLDCETCARAVLDLALAGRTGLCNVAARDCMDKEGFARALAKELGVDPDWAETGSVASLATPRAESLGLDVSRAEAALGRPLPTAREAVANLARQYRHQSEKTAP